jgi:hypothetical protein
MPKKQKMKKLKTIDSSGIGMKPPKVYQVSSLNVEKEVKEKKQVKEKDVFELPKKKSRY